MQHPEDGWQNFPLTEPAVEAMWVTASCLPVMKARHDARKYPGMGVKQRGKGRGNRGEQGEMDLHLQQPDRRQDVLTLLGHHYA